MEDKQCWIEKECKNVQMFQFGVDPEIIYVIKTGFRNTYMVVNEDAYHYNLGETKWLKFWESTSGPQTR